MKSFLKVMQYIWFSLLGIFEFVMCIGIIGATLSGDEPIEPISAAIVLTFGFALLTMINIGGIARLAGNKKFVFFSTLLMKLFTAVVALTAVGYLVSGPEYMEAYIFLLFVSLGLGLGAYFFGRFTDKTSPIEPYSGNMGTVFSAFTCDKAEWSWEVAAKEYFGGNFISDEISESESDRIFDYAAMPIACYLCWLLRRDLVTEAFYEGLPDNLVAKVKSGFEDPLELFSCMDNTLTRDMISSKAHYFTDAYYWSEKTNGAYNNDTYGYQFDYFDIMGEGKNYYVNEFSWDKQMRLEEVLDKRFTIFSFDEDHNDFPLFTKVYSELYGDEVEIKASKNVPKEYARACAEQIAHPDKELAEKICGRLNDFREEYGEEPLKNRNDIFKLFGIYAAFIYPPVDDGLAYNVIGGGKLEEEHGCGFTVNDRYVTEVCYADDLDAPWSADVRRWRRIENISSEKVRKMSIIPHELGGSDSADNTVSAPEVIADFKDECDKRIICLMKQRTDPNIRYSCEPIYDNGRVIGVTVSLTSGGKNIFMDRIKIRR